MSRLDPGTPAETSVGQEEDFWFRKFVSDKLDSLQRGYETLAESQTKLHVANQEQVTRIMESFDRHKQMMSEDIHHIRLTLESFQLVRSLVFGGVGVVLIAVVGALITLIIKKG